MTHELRLADIGEGLEEAEIIAWKVTVGDAVERDQPIVEILTDKSSAELPAPVSGVVVELGGRVGDLVHVGQLLAVIEPSHGAEARGGPSVSGPHGTRDGKPPERHGVQSAGELGPTQPALPEIQIPPTGADVAGPYVGQVEASRPVPSADSAASLEPVADTFREAATASYGQSMTDRPEPPAPPPTPPTRPKAAPSTRAEAARRGVDLSQLKGSGPGGRILLSDLDRAAGGAEPTRNETGRSANVAKQAANDAGSTVNVAKQAANDADSIANDADSIANDAGAGANEWTGPRAVRGQGAAVVPLGRPVPATTRANTPLVTATSSADPDLAPGPDEPTSHQISDQHAIVPLRGIRRVIAANMHESWSTIPHIHCTELVDAEPMLRFRAQLKNSGRHEFQALTPIAFFAAAVASAMGSYPQANATLDLQAGTITNHDSVNVGIAVATANGLVVPVLRHADQKSLAEISREVGDLVTRARNGELEASDYRGGTVTVTNFGSLGGEQAMPLIRPPESVIFGFGSIKARPFVVDGAVIARRTLHTVIGTDHRLLDGDVTTAMLRHVADLLASPINLVLD